jgi:hypothetical protein
MLRYSRDAYATCNDSPHVASHVQSLFCVSLLPTVQLSLTGDVFQYILDDLVEVFGWSIADGIANSR